MSPTFVRRGQLPGSAAPAFAWHGRPGPFARLRPPWRRMRVIELAAVFAWRHRLTRLDLERLHRGVSLTVAVTGAGGMIGRELVAFLSSQGCTVKRLVRRRAHNAAEIEWDPARGLLDPATLAGVD